MLYITCPYTQETLEEEEFTYAGEAHIVRPLDPESLSDEEWGDYLFFRKNTRGVHHEMWYHVGTRRYFNVTRDTETYEILETYKMGEQPKITSKPIKEGAR